VIGTESAQALAVPQKETKMRTAPPRPRNAFGLGSRLVRRHLRLLSELPAALSTKLFANANRVRLAAGKILFRAGAPGDGCYRVEDGLLKVTMVSSSSNERILEFLGPGAIVGELSIIDGLPRSATVVAVRDATLSSVSRAEFEGFCRRTSRGLQIAREASCSPAARDGHHGSS
jgi:CRP-like cAMP-binding protein